MGQINATSFDADFLEKTIAQISADSDRWNEAQRTKIAMCTASRPADLTPRRQAIFSYLCALSTLLVQCDQQYEHSLRRLYGQAFERRVRYFSGTCPMSPKPLREAFGMKTPSWANCSGGMYTGEYTNLLHDSEVKRFTCLWRKFETRKGKK